jgi:hypothetical protein
MVETTGPLLCRCKIEKQKIVFCAIHQAAENLLLAVEYSRNFFADHAMAEPGIEATKTQIVLSHLEKVLAKARRKPE